MRESFVLELMTLCVISSRNRRHVCYVYRCAYKAIRDVDVKCVVLLFLFVAVRCRDNLNKVSRTL